mmetsp:Transcript_16132/g.37767  ORF Transcript_16132/g.37767 Transcript_16132/m.37767 type:complete len:201 (+) Transcript_16132:532-1134(+)
MVCTIARRQTTLKCCGFSSTCSESLRSSARSAAAFPPVLLVKPPACDRAVRLWVLPPEAHHCCSRLPSGVCSWRTSAPPSLSEPLRPPFHSLTCTPLRPITGWSAKSLSACLARSPQMVTTMVVAVSSAMVMSRLTRSRPSLEVKEITLPGPVTTPHTSTLQGSCRDCSERNSEKWNFTASICASSSTSSTCANLSKTRS